MNAAVPPDRIHLRMTGVPQDTAEITALAIAEVLRFCRQPETFPVFHRWAVTDAKQAADSEIYARIFGALNPGVLRDIEHMIAAGALADLDEAGQ